MIHQLIPDFIWAPSLSDCIVLKEFSKQACIVLEKESLDGAQMKSGNSWCIKKLKCSHDPTIKMLLNNHCATYFAILDASLVHNAGHVKNVGQILY